MTHMSTDHTSMGKDQRVEKCIRVGSVYARRDMIAARLTQSTALRAGENQANTDTWRANAGGSQGQASWPHTWGGRSSGMLMLTSPSVLNKHKHAKDHPHARARTLASTHACTHERAQAATLARSDLHAHVHHVKDRTMRASQQQA